MKHPAIKSTRVGCLCCGSTDEMLPLDTVMYYGFGGWRIRKDEKPFYIGENDTDYDHEKKLSDIEEMIGENTEDDFTAYFDSVRYSAKYQRHKKNHWVLIEEGNGFA